MVKYLIMDVDGTLTDGKVYIGNQGELMKAFDIKDGYGIHDILIPAGVIPVIITGRESDIVVNRAKEIGIEHIYQGEKNKTAKIHEITNDLSQVAFIGEDINDLSCMKLVKNAGGIVACPADAVRDVKEVVDHVCNHNGGNGAVREFIEWLIK